mmetsp:Transcript_6094/g.24287  ORF Transcript_6094/g.24287 Transcript_6094/m.24287 type:complete len:222 (-) Transcript_6094:4537-5202(-)
MKLSPIVSSLKRSNSAQRPSRVRYSLLRKSVTCSGCKVALSSVNPTMSEKKTVTSAYRNAPTFSPRVRRAATSGGSMRSRRCVRRWLDSGSNTSPHDACSFASTVSHSSRVGRRASWWSRQSSMSCQSSGGAFARMLAVMVGRSFVSDERTASSTSRGRMPAPPLSSPTHRSEYGVVRDHISYSSMPKAYTSDISLCGWPSSNSGAIQKGVPTTPCDPPPS